MKRYGLVRALFVRLLSTGLILTVTACVAVAKPHASRKSGSGAAAAESRSTGPQAASSAKGASRAESRPPVPIHHTIVRGQTLYRIAAMYGVSIKEICRANGIKDPARVKAGTVIEIPRRQAPAPRAPQGGADAPLVARSGSQACPSVPEEFVGPVLAGSPACARSKSQRASGGQAASARLCSEKTAAAAQACLASPTALLQVAMDDTALPGVPDEDDWADEEGASDIGPAGVTFTLIPSDDPFSWPLQGGEVRSPFGKRRGRLHAGIDIAAPYGTLVYAARDGVVTFSGRKRGYGNVVTVDHGDGFATLYAHNSKNLVREGDRVVRGQLIAKVGATGNATGAHCHFEIRKTNIALDPTRYLYVPDTVMTAASRDTKTDKPTQINKAGIGVGFLPIP